jgi:mannose-6-phosphate isomerase
VYDYGRKDKYGNTRELHVEKALAVSNLTAYTPLKFKENVLGECAYFRVERMNLHGEIEMHTDGTTFHRLTCIHGVGWIDGQEIKKGDTFFVPANFGSYQLKGNMAILFTTI